MLNDKTAQHKKFLWSLKAVVISAALLTLLQLLIATPIEATPRHQGGCTTVQDSYTSNESIEPIGNSDCFTFQGTAGNLVTAFAENQTTGGSKQLKLTIFNPDGSTLGTASSTFGGWNIEVRKTLTATGRHTIIVDGITNTTGPYVFGFSNLADDTHTIEEGQGYPGEINQLGDEDGYSFLGTAGDLVTAFAENQTTYGRQQLTLIILNPDGSILGKASSTFGGWNVEVRKTLTATGRHTIIVDGAGNTTGPYILGYSNLSQDTAPIINEQPVGGNLDYPGDEEAFTFWGCSGDQVTVFGENKTIYGNQQLALTVFNPDGSVLAKATSTFGGWNVEVQKTFTATGLYKIIMDGVSHTTGPYTLTLSILDFPPPCIQPGVNLTVSATDSPDPVDLGASLTYLINVSNQGADNASGVTLTSTLPAGVEHLTTETSQGDCNPASDQVRCTLGSLGSGGTASISLTVKTLNTGTLINQIEVSGNEGETILTDNLVRVSTVVSAATNVISPTITRILPPTGPANTVNIINIYGNNFASGAIARLNDTSLTTVFVNPTHLQATVPAGLNAETYDLSVINPDGGQASMQSAYTVLGSGIDDLFAFSPFDLWTDPPTLHAGGDGKIGLLVRRRGGKNTLADVEVKFYAGDPDTNGILLGSGIIPLLSPRGSANAFINLPATLASGTHTLYAVIDPDETITESNEDNNTIKRTLKVLAQRPDQLPPHVDDFTINDGATATDDRQVSLDTQVSDPSPSSGVQSLLFIEYEYSQGASGWLPVRISDWLDYATAQTDYPWELLPTAGLKYLQAWASDGAGNISIDPFIDTIRYLPSSDQIAQGQARIYRYTLKAGDTLTARIIPSSGDPDLYIWPPDHDTRGRWVSNLSDGTDEVSFDAPVDGLYQVEIYGYTAATYQATVQVTSDTSTARPPSQAGGEDPTKPQPDQPIIALTSLPGRQIGLPALPDKVIYLPLVIR